MPVLTVGHSTHPIGEFIELLRAPLLGGAPAPLSWAVTIGMLVIGSAFALLLLNRASKRIVFWV